MCVLEKGGVQKGEGRVGTTLHLNGMGVAHTHTYIYTYAAKLILQLHFRIGAEKD